MWRSLKINAIVVSDDWNLGFRTIHFDLKRKKCLLWTTILNLFLFFFLFLIVEDEKLWFQHEILVYFIDPVAIFIAWPSILLAIAWPFRYFFTFLSLFFSLLVWPIVCDLSIHEYRGENNTLFARCFLTWRVNRINDKWQLDSFHLSKSFKGKGNNIYYRHSLCKYTGTFLL
jgi:hypothetical protein